MSFVVTETCIRCKYTDCVEVCPVDCFYEGENMLVINPDECIDCGVCEGECPVEAIVPIADELAQPWIALNVEFSEKWPRITSYRTPAADATDFDDELNKFEKYFSPQPGVGGE